MRNTVFAALLAVAAVIVMAMVAVAVNRGSSGPPAYLATSSGQVEFITWQDTGNSLQGTIAYDSLSGTAPSETVSVQSTPFTGSINGSTVTMTVNGGFLVGSRTVTATLNGGTLSLSYIGSSGSIQTTTLIQSSTSAYNAAVATLHKNADHSNVVAERAQAAQQAEAQAAQEKQTAQNDIATLLQDTGLASGSNLSGDLSDFAGDVQSSNSDLKTTQQDSGQSKGYCNASMMVNGDTESLDGDLQSIQGDIQSLRSDMATVHQDIKTVEADAQRLQNQGLLPPNRTSAQAAIATAKANLSQAISKANGYIDQASANDAQGYQIAQGLATASCSGPGNPPSPVPHIR